MKKFLKAAGLFSLLYYGLIISYAGIRTTFAKFWLISGGFFVALSQLPAKWLAVLKYPLGLVTAFFCAQEFKMLRMARAVPAPGADYMIILGARVKGRCPTRSLLRRIHAGAEYLKQNPATKVIGSGGRGPGEDISEAECICETLVELGISRDRILLEDQSVSTRENLFFSMKMTGTKGSYVLVTNGFHMYRTITLAKELGMEGVSGLSASSEPVLLLNYYVREFFALIFNKLTKKGVNL